MKNCAGVIINFGNHLIGLQLRDCRPEVEFSGQVGFFGGGVDHGEQIDAALFCEIYEELGLSPTDYEFESVGAFEYLDGFCEPCMMHLFILSRIDFSKLKIFEGHLCITDISHGIGDINLVEAIRPMLFKALELLSQPSLSCLNGSE